MSDPIGGSFPSGGQAPHGRDHYWYELVCRDGVVPALSLAIERLELIRDHIHDEDWLRYEDPQLYADMTVSLLKEIRWVISPSPWQPFDEL